MLWLTPRHLLGAVPPRPLLADRKVDTMITEHKIISLIVALLLVLGLGVVVNAIWGEKIFN